MIEIKYRAYHTVLKRMFSCEEMVADEMALLPDGRFINVSGVSTRLSEIAPRDVMIPLQFTGLVDKNGVEIFEGDILKYCYRIMPGRGSIPGYYREQIVVRRTHCGYTISHFTQDTIKFPQEYFEVIGNIHENPELEK